MKLTNKGISFIELLAVLTISSIIVLSLAQAIISLSRIQVDHKYLTLIGGEGILLTNDINYEYDNILAFDSEPCVNNTNCIILVEDSLNKLQIGFIPDADTGEKIEIIKTVDGTKTTRVLSQSVNMKNTTITQVCHECSNGRVYVLEFQLYFENKYTKSFRTSFRIR
ncbi:hypothetical protein RJG79_05560 [Mycoplasmatota bacterium WC44]